MRLAKLANGFLKRTEEAALPEEFYFRPLPRAGEHTIQCRAETAPRRLHRYWVVVTQNIVMPVAPLREGHRRLPTILVNEHRPVTSLRLFEVVSNSKMSRQASRPSV
jgi:hypothetical protein